VDEEFEIYGQRLSATGAEVGANDFRISQMGPDGDANFDSAAPDLAYGSKRNEYLVSWQAEDNAAPLVDDEFEIFGRRVSAGSGKLDTGRPRLRLRFRKAQSFQRAVVVGVTSSERASLTATARAGKARLKSIRRGIDAKRRAALRFKLTGKARRASSVRIRIRLTDAAGNSRSKKLTVRRR
jgi:hypothetical protein